MKKSCKNCLWVDDDLSCSCVESPAFHEYLMEYKPCSQWKPKYNEQAKSDSGKPQLTLVPRSILPAIARVREYGTKKYGDPENWKQVEKQRYRDAAFRHFCAYLDDPGAVGVMCNDCKHNHRDFTCDAYPEGIPKEILLRGEHDTPFPGDKGIRFEPKD